MFLKRIRVAKDGKSHTYWALVKSVRTARGPRHQVVTYLGELQSGHQASWAHVARILDHRPEPCHPLFNSAEPNELVPEKVEVRVGEARVERTRDFGDAYLGLVLWRALQMDRLKTHDVVLPTSTDREVRIRCVTMPDTSQRILLGRLGLELPKRLGKPKWASARIGCSQNF